MILHACEPMCDFLFTSMNKKLILHASGPTSGFKNSYK
jgi:hypothetical protein